MSSSSSVAAPGGTGNTDRVKTFMTGIVSPFTACWQPSLTSCVSGGCAPDSAFQKQPAVVSPLVPRHSPSGYRDSRGASPVEDLQASAPDGAPSAVTSSSGRMAADDDAVPPPGGFDVEKPHSNDILCGRGGSSNRHRGNIHFRELVAANKKTYVGLTKKQKMLVARNIVDAIRSTDPPGRFLAKDLDTGMFYDIGLPRSLEKTSQALREKNSNEMPEGEGEGIETSVESYNSVVGSDAQGSEVDESPVTSPSAASCTKTPRSSKHVEAPPLVIPPHLMGVFGPHRAQSNQPQNDEWSGYGHVSPGGPGHHMAENSPYQHHSPYPPAYSMSDSPSPHHPHALQHKGYPPGPRPPPVPPAGQYHRGHYPSSTDSVHPPHRYGEPPVPYYYPPHPHTPPYGSYDGRYGRPEGHYPQNNRESYGYYPRSAEHADNGSSRSPPHRMDPYRGCHPPPPPPHYHGGSAPGAGFLPPSHPGHSRPPALGPHHHPSSPPPPFPPNPHISNGGQHRAPGAPPLPTTAPALPRHPDHVSEGRPSPQAQAAIFRTSSNNGHVRGTSEVSPERQRDSKRQRNVDGHTRRMTTESSLSAAIKNSLSLEERVVGRERHRGMSGDGGSYNTGRSSSSSSELMSPSTILQSRSRRGMDDSSRAKPSERREDYSALSGLAALSTAAFLKLDEV